MLKMVATVGMVPKDCFWRTVPVYLSVEVVECKSWMEHVNELADSGKILQRA
jgi:hypothetical protein